MISARFLPEAEAEFAEAAEFYEAAEPGLGQAFTQEVERTVDRMCAFPESGATLGTVVRCAIVSNFPFFIVYRIGSGEIVIAAVAHQRRRPGCQPVVGWLRMRQAAPSAAAQLGR